MGTGDCKTATSAVVSCSHAPIMCKAWALSLKNISFCPDEDILSWISHSSMPSSLCTYANISASRKSAASFSVRGPKLDHASAGTW